MEPGLIVSPSRDWNLGQMPRDAVKQTRQWIAFSIDLYLFIPASRCHSAADSIALAEGSGSSSQNLLYCSLPLVAEFVDNKAASSRSTQSVSNANHFADRVSIQAIIGETQTRPVPRPSNRSEIIDRRDRFSIQHFAVPTDHVHRT